MDGNPAESQSSAECEEECSHAPEETFETYSRLSSSDRSFLQLLKTLPLLGTLSIAEERIRMREGQTTAASEYSVTVEQHQTTSCTVQLIRPLNLAAPAPILFYLHGGGWVLGSIETHRRLVCELVLKGHCVIAFVDYPCAPEHVFPASLEASITAITEILNAAETLGLDSARFIIGGDSAGGNLAAAVILECTKRKLPLPARQILLWPVTNHSDRTCSYRQFEGNPNLSRAAMQWFWSHYLPDTSISADPRISPLQAEEASLAQFPPTLLVTCEYDILRDEGEAFAARLLHAGVDVTAVRWLGSLHGFLVNEALCSSESARTCIEMVAQYIRRGFEGDGSLTA